MDQVLPLDSSPNQTFRAALDVDGSTVRLAFAFHYNEVAEYWEMSISDANGDPLLNYLPMVSGDTPAANLLEQYSYLGIGSAYLVNVSGTAGENPTETDLGTNWQLVWGDTQ